MGSLTVVTPNGSISVSNVCRLTYLLLLASLSYLTAMAVSDAMQKLLDKYMMKKDSLMGYFVYALVMIILLIVVAYLGCRSFPDIVEYINLSPL